MDEAERAAPLVVEFSVGKSLFDDLEENGAGGDDRQALVADALCCFERAARLVREQGVFSAGERLDDTPTPSLKYLLIPFCMGRLYTMGTDFAVRRANLEKALGLFDAFLQECRAREILTPEEQAAFEREDAPPAELREEKVKRVQHEKALRTKMQAIVARQQENQDGGDDEEGEREFVVSLLHVSIGHALDELRTTAQEVDMLTMMESRGGRPPQPPAREQDQRMRPQPAPEPQNGAGVVSGGAWNLRSHIQARVFTSGLSKPTMSLEEYADLELQQALRRQEAEREREAARQQVDPESEQAVEAQALKDRRWDDFKDDNPRGAGNTGLRSMFDAKAFQQENPQYKL